MKDTLKNFKRVYGRPLAALTLAAATALPALPAAAQVATPGNILEARDAYRKRDRARLATLRAAAVGENQALAPWVDYWDLNSRLNTVQVDEVEAFYQRWPGTYVEDRLRNDWLLELGRRRDWKALAADYPRFRMNDDRQVVCYALLADHLAGKDVREAGRDAWFAQKEGDDGCTLLATTLFEAKQLGASDVWRRARAAVDANKPAVARTAVQLVAPSFVGDVSDVFDSPARYLAKKKPGGDRAQQELVTLALMRLAASDIDATVNLLNTTWQNSLRPDQAAWAWATVGKKAALALMPAAPTYFQQADLLATKTERDLVWADEVLAWKARAALRNEGGPRWQQVMQAVNAMDPKEQADPTWVYWKARALQALARDSSEPAAFNAQSQEMLASIAGQYHFYGSLAAEELGRPITMPAVPAPLTSAEKEAAARVPGLTRAILLINAGLRSEGNREWNFTLRGMDDRTLRAAAELGCERALWDRCINTSDRTKAEIDMAQRFPTPFRRELTSKAKDASLDPAYVYGLIRQESRFIADARSGVGAAGLMQLMPATARWTAKKTGTPFTQDMITDRDMNLKLGMSYLKLVLDDLGGSQAMAAAAYNAGPGRPRRWREGPRLEPAIWVENVPFSETRDYVKKVLSNATFYSALLNNPNATQAPSLKARLGRSIGPREAGQPAPDAELP